MKSGALSLDFTTESASLPITTTEKSWFWWWMYYDLWEWQWPDRKKIAGLNNNDKHHQRNRRWDQEHESLVPKSKVHLCRARKIYLNVTDNSLNEFEMQIAQDEAKKCIERCQLVNWEFVQVLDWCNKSWIVVADNTPVLERNYYDV